MSNDVKETVLNNIGFDYEYGSESSVPMFKPKSLADLHTIEASVSGQFSWGYYLTAKLAKDMAEHEALTDTELQKQAVVTEDTLNTTAETQAEQPAKPTATKTILMYDAKDHSNLIKTFNSLQEACDFINKPDKAISIKSGISKCLSGKVKSACGYYWEYNKN